MPPSVDGETKSYKNIIYFMGKYSISLKKKKLNSLFIFQPNTPNPEVSVWLVSLENLSQNSISPRPVPLPRTMLSDG